MVFLANLNYFCIVDDILKIEMINILIVIISFQLVINLCWNLWSPYHHLIQLHSCFPLYYHLFEGIMILEHSLIKVLNQVPWTQYQLIHSFLLLLLLLPNSMDHHQLLLVALSQYHPYFLFYQDLEISFIETWPSTIYPGQMFLVFYPV